MPKLPRFTKYPVCKACGYVWNYDDCFEGYGAHKKTKLCSNTSPFRKRKCNGSLLKIVELPNCTMFYLLLMYCYVDLCSSLQQLLLYETFVKNFSHWKSRLCMDNVLSDVYDVCVWKKFLNYNGRPFLSEDCSYAFIINIDWFQPHKHLTYSVGVDLSSCTQPSKITALSVAEYLSRRNYSRPF